MTEDYLQNLWANKRIPSTNVQLVDGRDITIHKVGDHNKLLSGPDFFMGEITIDKVRYHGNIEIHTKASDWYRHMHHEDENYNNVILHVVYENDRDVIQNGFKIPTYELKSHIDWQHYKMFIEKKIKPSEFACQNLLNSIDSIYLESMLSKAIYQKLNAKQTVVSQSGFLDRFELFYHLLGLAFGTSINQIPFNTLLEKVPYSSMKELSRRQKYQLLISESGIIQSKSKGAPKSEQWHFKGTRPRNFPTIRVKQFAFIASRFEFESVLQFQDVVDVKKYFNSMIDTLWGEHDQDIPSLSEGFKDHLLINAVVPFIWIQGEQTLNDDFRTSALELLERIPPEKNAIIRKWNNIGLKAENAFESQAFLALHRYYCCHKKCLSCAVGSKIMNRSE